MFNTKPYTNIVFFDIETIAQYPTFDDAPAALRQGFNQQYSWLIEQDARDRYDLIKKKKEGDEQLCYQQARNQVWSEKAHLSPEYGKVVCISAGMILADFKFKCLSFTGADEKEILTKLNQSKFVNQNPAEAANNGNIICCHNAGWDLSFVSRRLLYNGLELPPMLDNGHLKPWEKNFLVDTKEHLKFGSMEAPPLETLCFHLNVETALQKHGDPSQIKEWQTGGKYDLIADYCSHDVFALAQCYIKLIRSKEHPAGIQNQLIKS